MKTIELLKTGSKVKFTYDNIFIKDFFKIYME